MRQALKDKIKKAAHSNLRSETIEVPEWDGAALELRTLTVGAQNVILDTCYVHQKDGTSIANHSKLYPALLIHGAFVPGTDERLWQAGDEGEINSFDPEPVRRIANRILTLSGLSKEAEVEAVGNSSETPGSDSSYLSLAS